MHNFIVHFCTVCGREKTRDSWLLIGENRWMDKLTIFQWDELLAGIHSVCGAAHASELIVHWMKTSSLKYPFPAVQTVAGLTCREIPRLTTTDRGINRACQLGELSVHRESIVEILGENPQFLATMVDELMRGLGMEESESQEFADGMAVACPY